MTSLHESSILNEYYWGDLPGNLQYSKDVAEFLQVAIPANEDTKGYVFAEHSSENKRRVIPDTAFAKNNYKLLLVVS